MEKSEPILLYKCHCCAAPVYKDWIDRGDACRKCGSRHITAAPPTFWYVLRYLWHSGSVLKYLKENLLRWA